jgi:ABC-type multidrug transport system fused ATPase/permease subunit
VSKFGKYLESFYDLVAALDKVGSLLDLPPERQDGMARAADEKPARLEVDRVAFSYDGQHFALKDITFHLEPGAQTAIFGGDASGKSTLVDLLYALLAPSRGVIKLDGVDIRTQRLSDLRRDVMLVGQPELVDATVLDNVRFGREDVDTTAISEALGAVGLAEELTQLPKGALTVIGPQGSRLTSSQAVRLMIARSLVCQPRLLILDEALDGLDMETARLLLRGLHALRRKTTLLVFTSREDIAQLLGNWWRLERGNMSSILSTREDLQ